MFSSSSSLLFRHYSHPHFKTATIISRRIIDNTNSVLLLSFSTTAATGITHHQQIRSVSFAASSSDKQGPKQAQNSSSASSSSPRANPHQTPKSTATRTYLTGFEHDPTYGPEAKRKEMLARGLKLPPEGSRKAAYTQDVFEASQNQSPHASGKRQDSRFTRKMKDFREMEDDDPYRELFGEKRSFVRSKVGAWRSQFEKENEHVELPYERSGFLTRTAPNWFVKWMIGLRENQGLDFIYLFGAFGTVMILVALWLNATVVPFGKEKNATEMK